MKKHFLLFIIVLFYSSISWTHSFKKGDPVLYSFAFEYYPAIVDEVLEDNLLKISFETGDQSTNLRQSNQRITHSEKLVSHHEVQSKSKFNVGDQVLFKFGFEYYPATIEKITSSGYVQVKLKNSSFTAISEKNFYELSKVIRFEEVQSKSKFNVGDQVLLEFGFEFYPATIESLTKNGYVKVKFEHSRPTASSSENFYELSKIRHHKNVSEKSIFKIGDEVFFQLGFQDYPATIKNLSNTGMVQVSFKNNEFFHFMNAFHPIDRIKLIKPKTKEKTLSRTSHSTDEVDVSKYSDSEKILFKRLKKWKLSASELEFLIQKISSLAKNSVKLRKKLVLLLTGKDPGRHWRFSKTNKLLAERAAVIINEVYSSSQTKPEQSEKLRFEPVGDFRSSGNELETIEEDSEMLALLNEEKTVECIRVLKKPE